MRVSAHPSFENALLAAALVSLASLRSQEIVPAPRYAAVDELAIRALDASDPVARGEAALWLADSGRRDQYQAILDTAADEARPARLRGILAVGRLGAPGAQSFLGKVLDSHGEDSPEAAAAAFALGTLEDHVTAPAVDALLARLQGGSRKRLAPLLRSLLGGLASRPHPSRTVAMRSLRDDEANRGDTTFVLAQAALRTAGVLPSRELVNEWLHADLPAVRLAALTCWQSDWRPTRAERARFVRMARTDGDPSVRAASLDLLARFLAPEAVELSERALQSRHHEEAATAARILVRLAGSSRCAEIEERALDPAHPAEMRAALLDALGGILSPAALLTCADVARDARAPSRLRAASALALHAGASTLAPRALEAVFADIEDGPALVQVTVALREHGLLAEAATRLTTPDTELGSAALLRRVRAVALADPMLGTELFLTLVENEHLRGDGIGRGLAALRAGRVPALPHDLVSLLPPAVAELAP